MRTIGHRGTVGHAGIIEQHRFAGDRAVGERRIVEENDFGGILRRNGVWQRVVGVGDRVPTVSLIEADLGPIHLDRLRMTGPIVLLFFRHAGSSACGAALRLYRDSLAPALTPLDAHLVAVSPQVPDRLRTVKRRHDLDFFVATDPRHTLIDALNLGFTSPGADVALGTGHAVLPFAAAVVIDRSGIVRFAEVRPDWSAPVPARPIIDAVTAIVRQPERRDAA